ncbi:hypothetical protein [Deinococcus radiotolerans]|uniref:hypothetical protein n=1 Tax=Deinococcus radiotolerans TaxID=1309407 RepID=UPI00166B9774|nr:hypothetical protein [Deinococcus radiotolerans]
MIDIHSVDVSSSQLFQAWYLEQHEAGTPVDTIIEALETIDSVPARLRALHLAYRSNRPAYPALARWCVTSGDPLALETVKGYEVYQRSITILQEGGPHMQTRHAEMRGALQYGLKTLRALPQTDLVVEGQTGLMIPLVHLLALGGEAEEAIETASQALFLAEQLKAPLTIARVRTALISCTSNAGRAVATIEMVRQEQRLAIRHDPVYTDLELASGLFRLGAYADGAAVLEAIIARTEGARRDRIMEFLQRTEAIWGIGGLDGPTYATHRGSTPIFWLTDLCQSMMKAYATPREGRDAEERAQHFAQVLEHARGAGAERPVGITWYQGFAQWARATAHLGRGEYADAAVILEHTAALPHDYLDLRILLSGAALELALSWHAPEGFSLARHEQALRQTFQDAERLPYASPEGLATLLHRWHPTATAYLALVPQPVTACAFATKSILKVGQHNLLDDVILPPVYACDLVLRALDFDLRRDFIFVQGDAGGGRKKKKALMTCTGSVPVWRLPISAVKLAYGLMCHHNATYHDQARTVLRTYGIRPATAALYPMIGTLDAIEQGMQDLLNGHLTPKGLTARMHHLSR